MDLGYIFGLYSEIKDDLKFVTSSDIRAKIIISLNEGQKKLSNLKDEVCMSSSAILHNMNQLESRNLIIRGFQGYSLSQTGEIVALNLITMVDSLSLMKTHKDFWLNHEINEIPEDLINRIECLGDFKVIKSSTGSLNLFTFKESLLDSKSIKGIIPLSVLHDEFFMKILNEKKDIQLILTNKTINEHIKVLNSKNQRDKIKIERNILWKTGNDLKLTLIVTDNFLLLNLPPLYVKNDSISYLISRNNEAIKWGNKLFNHYLNQSEELK